MEGPADPAERSVAPEGEVADVPDDLTVIEVTDQDDDVVGLLIKWDAAEWVWADISSYQSLEDST